MKTQIVSDEVIINMLEAGTSYRKIEEFTGISAMQISRIKKRHNMMSPKISSKFSLTQNELSSAEIFIEKISNWKALRTSSEEIEILRRIVSELKTYR